MGSSLTEFKTKIGYHLGCSITDTSPRWNSAQIASLLNSAQKNLIRRLLLHRCWKLLRELTLEKTYTLTGADSYSVYDIINSSNYFYFISDGFNTASRIDNNRLFEVSIYDEEKVLPGGELDLKCWCPFICFYSYDSDHYNLPLFRIYPAGITGTLYFRYLKIPPQIDDTNNACLPPECDDAMIFLVCAYCWSGDRNSEEFIRFNNLFHDELNQLINLYAEPNYIITI